MLIFRQRDLRLVNFLLAVSTLAVGAVLALRGVKEPFDAASDIGTVVSDLGIGYIAAWMFYALTIWRPRDADRRRLARGFLRTWSDRISLRLSRVG